MVENDRSAYEDQHARIIIVARRKPLQLRGRIHLRRLCFVERNLPLPSDGGPYITMRYRPCDPLSRILHPKRFMLIRSQLDIAHPDAHGRDRDTDAARDLLDRQAVITAELSSTDSFLCFQLGQQSTRCAGRRAGDRSRTDIDGLEVRGSAVELRPRARKGSHARRLAASDHAPRRVADQY